MNKILSLLVTALATAITSTTFAAVPTPVAVWDGDFSETIKGGYTLNLNNNKLSDDNSTITITNTYAGVDINFSQAMTSGMTVLFRYANLTAGDNAKMLATSCVSSDHSKDRTGIDLQASGQLRGAWYNGSSWADNGSEANSVESSGCLAFTYKGDVGTYLYYGTKVGTIEPSSIWGSSGLKSSSDTSMWGATVGGMRLVNTNWRAAQDMTITGIAIFDGVVPVSDLNEYVWPSVIRTEYVGSTSFSTINDFIAENSNAPEFRITLASGTTINIDEGLSSSVPVYFISEGSITLSADSAPDASYFTNADFTDVEGALKRSWLEPGVVGFNFNANGGRNAAGNTDGASDTSSALETGTWYKDAYSATGSTNLFVDGLSVLTWSSKNVYAEESALTEGTFIQGYLDDGNAGPIITLTAVPYESYDIIIYCSTDSSTANFKAKTVNGIIYTWDSTSSTVVTTNDSNAAWGYASATEGRVIYGANAMRINGLSGKLSIAGGTKNNNTRGCISAIQIMPAGTSTSTTPTLNLTQDANWSVAENWQNGTKATSGDVVINVSGDVTLTIDEAIDLGSVTVYGEGSLTLKTAEGVSSVSMDFLSYSENVIFSDAGTEITTVFAPIKYLYDPGSIKSSILGTTYTAGAGTEGNGVQISHEGGRATLMDGTYYLAQSHNATSTEVVFTNANVVYSDIIGIGQATYVLAGTTTLSTPIFILSQGANGRSSVFTLKDTASVSVSGTTDVDSNRNSIMFGHWDGPTTFTIQDEARFTATSQVLVGKTSHNHVININGGIFTAVGIKASASANDSNTINLNGGKLVLGSAGITTYNTSCTIAVNVNANTEICANDQILPITQTMAFSSSSPELSFKTNGVTPAVVQLYGGTTGTGNIIAGSGITLDVGTNRMDEVSLTIAEDAVLRIKLSTRAEIPVLRVSAEPSSVELYDIDGTTKINGAQAIYNEESGTITVQSYPIWTTSDGEGSFDETTNWSTDSVPTSGHASIDVTQDTTINVSGTYGLESLTFSGSGTVTFAGSGSITVDNLILNPGVKLNRKSFIPATRIDISSGAILMIDAGDNNYTESAVISGAGAVETYGNVTMGAANTFTGGITVKTGTLSTTNATGFGPYNQGWNCQNLKTVTVENGACVDIANSANVDVGYKLIITGKGVLTDGVYSGAVKYTGTETIGDNSRQISNIQLNGDALVDIGVGWGLIHHNYGVAALGLNGHTLTFRGTSNSTVPTVPMVNVDASASSGTIVLNDINLQLTRTACNFANVRIVARGRSTIDFTTAPTALGGLVLEPTSSGISASNWNLPDGVVPEIKASLLEPGTIGSEATIFTAPSGVELSSDTIAVNLGSRYTTTISGNTVSVTENSFSPFIHYEFNGSMSKSEDSQYGINISHSSDSALTYVGGKHGRAGLINSGATPYWGSNTSGKSPFFAGAMTVSALIKMNEADNSIVWNFGSGLSAGTGGIAVIAKDPSTVSLVAWDGGETTGSELVSVTGQSIVGNWHLITVVANGTGTTLYVDGEGMTTDAVIPGTFSVVGQFGSIHDTKMNYNTVSSGYHLDDFRVYDTTLSAREVRNLRVKLNPEPLTIKLR